MLLFSEKLLVVLSSVELLGGPMSQNCIARWQSQHNWTLHITPRTGMGLYSKAHLGGVLVFWSLSVGQAQVKRVPCFSQELMRCKSSKSSCSRRDKYRPFGRSLCSWSTSFCQSMGLSLFQVILILRNTGNLRLSDKDRAPLRSSKARCFPLQLPPSTRGLTMWTTWGDSLLVILHSWNLGVLWVSSVAHCLQWSCWHWATEVGKKRKRVPILVHPCELKFPTMPHSFPVTVD